ncbi:vasopressin V1a receptor-like [Amphiura filiformis]|uniref:vasopressin V1a receptor-like n=1 Tax=Amphiura filiformis TaxID=82378 RepID=UPI003B227DDC
MSDFPLNDSYSTTGTPDGDDPSKGSIPTDQLTQLIALAVIFVITIIGNFLVYAYLWLHRTDKARINSYVWALATADLLVALFPLLFNIVMSFRDNIWVGGDAACRLRMLMESVALMASSNIVVAIAVDRFYAVMFPLKKALNERHVITISWVLALLLSVPNLYVFRTFDNDRQNGTEKCRSIFRSKPIFHQQIYMTYVTIVVFIVPFIMICFTYFLIVFKLFSDQSMFQSSWKKSARWRTLKMTFVIIVSYLVCNTPFFVTELIIAYAGRTSVNPYAYSVFSVFVTCNSATNPFVFLYFNACKKMKKRQSGNETQTTMETQYTAPPKVTKGKNAPVRM